MTKKIRIDMFSPTNARVFLDDVEVKAVRGVTVKCAAGGINVVELVLFANEIEITGVAEVVERFVKVA
jgi:hypothetical protein